MYTLVDLSVSLDEEDKAVVMLTLGSEVTVEDVAELTKRLGQEFVLTPK